MMSALSSPTRPPGASRPRTLVAALAALGTAVAGIVAATSAGPASADEIEVNGLKGEYFATSAPEARDFAELGGVALDPNIEMPNLVPTFESLTGQGEHTTARWTGKITAPSTGEYTFYATGDNGFRLFIDDEPVIDHWNPDVWDVEQTSEPVHLEAGEEHTIRMEHFQDVGGANLYLRWSGPSVDKQIVPTSAFTPPDDFEVYPVELTAGKERVTARFEEPITDLGEHAEHLGIEVDTVPFPVEDVRIDPEDDTRMIIDLDAPIQQDQRVRFSYDGEAGLAVGGEAVPAILRDATNTSDHRLMTSWGENLDTENPLPEYPRPQQERDRWKNLNGPWQFAGVEEGTEPTFGEDLDEEIVVPFAVESQLSGIERWEQHMLYRKEVTVPAGWRAGDQRVKLNFGAVDHDATVYVNGEQVAEHTGGYTAFDADITDALRAGETQEIVVAVTDTTGPDQPKGKQTLTPGGITYTPVSGIWQTVWMEPVPEASIDDVRTTPDVEADHLEVEVASDDASHDAVVTAVARDADGEQVGKVTGPANEPLTLQLDDEGGTRLWSPDDPYLYDLDVRLKDGPGRDDRMSSYFGMRSVGVEKVGGVPKLVLNGEPIFSLAMLDQGYFPDGLYTAPSDEALAFDLQAQKDLGFNAVRKHIKVEPMRWFYHADKMGLLVWQDFVSGDLPTEAGQEAWLSEAKEMMNQVHSSPSVIGWVNFNEGWGEWDREATGRIAEEVAELDPSRVVNAHSGVNCCDSLGDSGKGDVIDHHDYTNTDPPFPDETRIAMDGEHGGFTLRTPGHQWPGAPAAIYSGVEDKAALTQKYVDNTSEFYLGRAGDDLSGSVYTQVTDLETELNGFWTYDRKEIKVDPGPVREINEQVIEAGANAGS